MRRKALTSAQVAMMFREFGVDLKQRTVGVGSMQDMRRVLDEARADAKREYKRLMFEHHPDRNGGDDTECKRLSEIWQTIERLQPAPPQPVPRPMSTGTTITITFGGGATTSSTTTSSTGWPPWAGSTY